MSQNDESFDESFEEDFDEDFEEDFEEFEEDDDALNALGMNYRMIHIQPMTQKNLQWKEFIKKKKERIHELQKFIHLSSTSIHTLLEIPPKTEYEIYKQSNKYKQSSIQYPSMESKCDVNIQTNELEYINHSTQSPDDIGLYTKANHHIHDCRNKNISMDSLKLLKFIRNTSMIFESLIKREESNETCNFIFSQSYRKFYHEEIQNNPLHEVLWNKFDPHYLLCNYSNHDKGYLIVYHMKLGYTKHLICNSMITSSIFLSSHLVLCGTKDGSLQLWDLSETDSLHKDLYRYPTYSTDWLIYENHKSPICNIVLLNDKESIQIASLDENGVLQYWIVVHTNDEIHEYDCGKSLFGKMKLLKTGENHLNTKCTTLEYKNHRFLIGTDHKIINGFKMYPKEYLTNHYINQIKFNPFKEYFLVVYNDNTIGLFDNKYKLLKISLKYDILNIEWSQHKFYEFYVLDNESNLYLFNIFHEDKPIWMENIKINDIHATCFNTFFHGNEEYLMIGYSNGVCNVHVKKNTKEEIYQNDHFKRLSMYVCMA